MSTRRLPLFAVLGFGAVGIFGAHSHAAAQTNAQSLGVSVVFQGYDFDNALGVDGAQLLMIPIAYRLPAGGEVLGGALRRLGGGPRPTGRPGLRPERSGRHAATLQLHGLALGHPHAGREPAYRQRHPRLRGGRSGVRVVLRHPGLPGVELGAREGMSRPGSRRRTGSAAGAWVWA